MTYVVPERVLELAKKGEWVGIDLDGTTFTYYKWVAWNVFGEPIMPMIERIRTWVAHEVPVRVVTARINLPLGQYQNGIYFYQTGLTNTCHITGWRYSDAMMAVAIQDKFASVGLPRFPVQPHKGAKMIELWDDRAVQVIANTGRTLAEEHEAELSALRGKQFQGTEEFVLGSEQLNYAGARTGRFKSEPPHVEEEEVPRGEYVSPGEAILRRHLK